LREEEKKSLSLTHCLPFRAGVNKLVGDKDIESNAARHALSSCLRAAGEFVWQTKLTTSMIEVEQLLDLHLPIGPASGLKRKTLAKEGLLSPMI
jgi:hypothetical protein